MPMDFLTSEDSSMQSCPLMTAFPDVGDRSVQRILIVVVFPAPFGPRNPNIVPSSTSKEISSTAAIVPESLDQVIDGNYGHIIILARHPVFFQSETLPGIGILPNIFNSAVKAAIGQDGAGNICVRCGRKLDAVMPAGRLFANGG